MSYTEMVDEAEAERVKDRYVTIVEYAKRGMRTKVEQLIEVGVDVNKIDYWGKTALIAAAERDDFELLKILVDAGADLNIRSLSEPSARGYAVHHKNKDMIDYIDSKLSQSVKELKH